MGSGGAPVSPGGIIWLFPGEFYHYLFSLRYVRGSEDFFL